MKKNNGFLLEDALFAFFVILVCASLILNGIYTLYFQRNLKIDEKIEKKWFYSESFCQGGAWIFFILLTQILSLLLPE